MRLTFELKGPPRPKERPRVTAKGTFTPKNTKEYQGAIANVGFVALQAALREGTVDSWPMDAVYEVNCVFSHKKPLASCPDGDNVLKAVTDALEGVLYANDRHVLNGSYKTLYSQKEAVTRVTVWVI